MACERGEGHVALGWVNIAEVIAVHDLAFSGGCALRFTSSRPGVSIVLLCLLASALVGCRTTSTIDYVPPPDGLEVTGHYEGGGASCINRYGGGASVAPVYGNYSVDLMQDGNDIAGIVVFDFYPQVRPGGTATYELTGHVGDWVPPYADGSSHGRYLLKNLRAVRTSTSNEALFPPLLRYQDANPFGSLRDDGYVRIFIEGTPSACRSDSHESTFLSVWLAGYPK